MNATSLADSSSQEQEEQKTGFWKIVGRLTAIVLIIWILFLLGLMVSENWGTVSSFWMGISTTIGTIVKMVVTSFTTWIGWTVLVVLLFATVTRFREWVIWCLEHFFEFVWFVLMKLWKALCIAAKWIAWKVIQGLNLLLGTDLKVLEELPGAEVNLRAIAAGGMVLTAGIAGFGFGHVIHDMVPDSGLNLVGIALVVTFVWLVFEIIVNSMVEKTISRSGKARFVIIALRVLMVIGSFFPATALVLWVTEDKVATIALAELEPRIAVVRVEMTEAIETMRQDRQGEITQAKEAQAQAIKALSDVDDFNIVGKAQAQEQSDKATAHLEGVRRSIEEEARRIEASFGPRLQEVADTKSDDFFGKAGILWTKLIFHEPMIGVFAIIGMLMLMVFETMGILAKALLPKGIYGSLLRKQFLIAEMGEQAAEAKMEAEQAAQFESDLEKDRRKQMDESEQRAQRQFLAVRKRRIATKRAMRRQEMGAFRRVCSYILPFGGVTLTKEEEGQVLASVEAPRLDPEVISMLVRAESAEPFTKDGSVQQS